MIRINGGQATLGANTFTGAQVAPSLALGGATIGSDALAVTGTTALGGSLLMGAATSITVASGGIVGVGFALDQQAAGDISTKAAGRIGFSSTSNPSTAPDTAFSRISAGIIGVGTGAAGNVAGGMQMATLFVGGVPYSSLTMGVATGSFGVGTGFNVSNAGNVVSGQLYSTGNVVLATNTGHLRFGAIQDTFVIRRAAANLNFGEADAALPQAQTLSVQSVVAGTTNIAGANWTFKGSQGTGTGAGGSLIFQTAPAGVSGSAVNALTTALTITSTGALQAAASLAIGGATIGSNALAVTGTSALGATSFSGTISSATATSLTLQPASGGVLNLNNNGGGAAIQINGPVLTWTNAGNLAWSSTSGIAAADANISRVSAGVIGVGTGAAGSAAGTLRATILEAVSELRFVSGTRLISQADGRFSFSIWDGTSKSQLDVSTTDTFKFRNATNSSDANITAGTATFSGSVITTGNYQFGTNQTVVEKGTNGALKIRNYGDTAGGIIDATTDGTFKFFGRDGTTPAPIQIGNTVNSVSPTSPNRTVTMVIGGTTYYLAAKTTND